MGWRALFLVIPVVLSGCANPTNRAAEAAQARSVECWSRQQGDPEFARIISRLPTDQPTMQQLSDSRRISPDEVALFSRFHNRAAECRRLTLEARQLAASPQVPVIASHYARLDRVYASLVRGEISWGDAAQQIVALRAQAQSESAEVSRGMRAEEDRRDMISAQRRQMFIQGMQQQQIIDNMNRPQTTNCQTVANQLQCTTR